MALQSSGQISIFNIRTEKGLSGQVSLSSLSTSNINQYSTKPDGVVPHRIKEFYGYNHTADPITLFNSTNWSGGAPPNNYADVNWTTTVSAAYIDNYTLNQQSGEHALYQRTEVSGTTGSNVRILNLTGSSRLYLILSDGYTSQYIDVNNYAAGVTS